MSHDSLVRRVARYGLPGYEDDVASVPIATSEFPALLRTVRRQRLAGWLHAAVAAGHLPVTSAQRGEVEALHLRTCVGALRLDRRLLQLAEELDEAGIDFLVLKGTAAAHLAYPDPAVRSYGDIDLLFPSDSFDSTLAFLYDLGYVRPAAPARPGFDRRFGKGATLKSDDGDELDVHRNLVFGTFGYAIELDELFRSAVHFELGGRMVRALGPETRLLHACYHASLGDPDPRYASVRDIAQMVLTGDHDPQRVLELARRWKSRAVLARGFSLVRDHLGVALDLPLTRELEGYVPTGRERRAIASYVGANRHFATKVVASLPYLTGVRDRVAFIRATALPSEGFVRTRGGKPGVAWIRRGVRSLLPGDPR
jgi:hypothetical protein